MFCNSCGNALQPNQSICPRCSVPVTVPYRPRTRLETHLSVCGILWIAYSLLHALLGVVLFCVNAWVFGGGWTPPGAPFFVGGILHFVAIFLIVTAAIGIGAGVGLMRAELWARPLIIALAIINLINAPLGAALGIYSLWVLLGGDSSSEYERLAAVKGAGAA